MQKIVFTGGGSAGHVIPNVALIRQLQKTNEYDLYYFGTDGIEKELIAPLKLPYFTFSAPKLKRSGSLSAWKNNLAIPHRYLAAVRAVKSNLKKLQPDLIFSKGGFVSLPVVTAAAKLKIPCLTHESDLSPGLANRLIQKKCKHVLTAFPETASQFSHGLYCGQPLRSELFNFDRTVARQQLAGGTNKKVLLIFGGGSGSAALNEAVRKIAPELCKKYYLLHVCGKNNLIDCNLPSYRQFEFISQMGAAYAAADLIISRAGAGAVFEAMALKKPALFIPLEGQTRGDQAENARYFFEKGLCYVLPQSQLSQLGERVKAALADETLRQNLLLSPYGSGTERTLQAIRDTLRRAQQ